MRSFSLIIPFLLMITLAFGQNKTVKIKKNKEYTSASGLKYIFFKINKKAEIADSGDVVYVHYVGKLNDSTIFDDSYSRNQALSFTLGTGRVIKGWDEGIALMHVGDSALLTIPPDIAYGKRDMGTIPPNSTLYFTVKLVKVKKPIKPYNVAGLDTIPLDSGLKYLLVKKGKGTQAKYGDRVYVNYSGYFTDGKKFDASYDRGEPIALVLGRHQVVLGWEMGIQGMKVGEQRRLLIPYPLAYGEDGRPPSIPKKSDLVFDVELMRIHADAIPKPFDVNGKDTITTESGLKYIIVQKADSAKVVPGDTVVVKYVAYFEDGKILESTYERDDSLSIVAGSQSMIPGIIEAVSVLQKGEKARVIIPYQLGFGEEGRPPVIPAKAILIFDMHIINVKKGNLVIPSPKE